MESRIPVPTDNIYKFYALFGLLLIVFSLGATIYVTDASNDFILNAVVEIEGIKQEASPSKAQAAKQKALERRVELTLSDRKTYQIALGLLLGIGVAGMGYGFRKWHKEIQPALDDAAKVQLETARLNLEKLKKEMARQEEG